MTTICSWSGRIAEPVLSDFDNWWQANGQWVEPPNLRRGGDSGVRLIARGNEVLYCKRQSGHLYRSLRHPWGQPTALRELQAYRALAEIGLSVPQVVYGAARKTPAGWQALLVTRRLEGYCSLEEWYAGPAAKASGEQRQAVLERLADCLARLHRHRWQHGCLYAKHIFVVVAADGSARVALIDLEKARRRLTIAGASQRDIGQLARHRGAMPAADWALLLDVYQRALAAGSAAGQS